ncbi:MAG: hypothetical protein JO108_16355 [Acidobacteriaceae bacterium]|nr:hypothetical protein [Acidobacteriaceae bacterium]
MSNRLCSYLLVALLSGWILVDSRLLDDQTDEAQRLLWVGIKKALTSDKGAEYFEHNMKASVIPGGANGVGRFRARVVSSKPEANPSEPMLEVNGEREPEAKLLLERGWKDSIPPGAEITFARVASSFISQPFLLTFQATDFEVPNRRASGKSK